MEKESSENILRYIRSGVETIKRLEKHVDEEYGVEAELIKTLHLDLTVRSYILIQRNDKVSNEFIGKIHEAAKEISIHEQLH